VRSDAVMEGQIIKKKQWEERLIHKINDNCTWWINKHHAKVILLKLLAKYYILKVQKMHS